MVGSTRGRLRLQCFAGLLGVFLLLLAAPAMAASPTLPADYQDGDLIAFSGTPHLYIVSGGKVRWLADTRAASQQTINWGRRHEVDIGQLEGWSSDGTLGDPILSFPLLREDPPPAGETCCPIHLVKQETGQAQPGLSWIRNIQDVGLFGITEQNYGQFVVGSAGFQASHGHDVRRLPRSDLAALTTAPPSSPPIAANTDDAARIGSWPPVANDHITYSVSTQWHTPGIDLFLPLTHQSVVASHRRIIPERPKCTFKNPHYPPYGVTTVCDTQHEVFLWVTALSETAYAGDDLDSMLRRTLSRWDDVESVSVGAEDHSGNSPGQLVAQASPASVAGVPARSVEYRVDVRQTGPTLELWVRDILFKRGDVFWLVEFASASHTEFIDQRRHIDAILASINLRYATDVPTDSPPAPSPPPIEGPKIDAWPPMANAHITFAFPGGWRRADSKPERLLAGQSVVATYSRTEGTGSRCLVVTVGDRLECRLEQEISIWIAALRAEEYATDTTESLLLKAVERWDKASDMSLKSRPHDIAAAAQSLTVDHIMGRAAEYHVEIRREPRLFREFAEMRVRSVVVQRGNVFWLIELAAFGARAFDDLKAHLDSVLSSVSFHY
ncbi:MAG: hypothetical protein CL878_02030 [Dehalococcoidia bacterium]|nr:hypothetical protein [Dehalococcoidia bacterium]